MLCETVTAGFGGQGILFLGDLLTRASLREGKYVTYLPTYGVAMRGGTANCVVNIADEPIGSPVLNHPHVAIILNEPSLVKFQPMVRPGGLIVANSSIIDEGVLERDDVRVVWIPATETAREVGGTERATNMAALGAFLGAEPIVQYETVEAVLNEEKDERKRAMIANNLAVIKAGMERASVQTPA